MLVFRVDLNPDGQEFEASRSEHRDSAHASRRGRPHDERQHHDVQHGRAKDIIFQSPDTPEAPAC